jgi:hypothetical protein
MHGIDSQCPEMQAENGSSTVGDREWICAGNPDHIHSDHVNFVPFCRPIQIIDSRLLRYFCEIFVICIAVSVSFCLSGYRNNESRSNAREIHNHLECRSYWIQ